VSVARAGECRQEGEHAARLCHPAAEAVGEHDLALAHRLHQPGHAEPRPRVEFQRIAEVGIEPAQQHLGALESGHRADEDAVVAHGQVFALDQEEAEIAGEIGVLEIGLVHRPGGEHADPGIVLAVEAGQFVLKRLEERRVAKHPQVAIDVGNPVGEREAVFQRIAGSGRRLGAVAQHPPAAIGAARDVDGIEAQVRAAGRRHVDERPHEVRAAGHERAGQAPLADELGRPVNVGQHRLDEARPPDQRGLQPLPLAGLDDERNVGQRPCPVGTLGVFIDAVEHAGFAQVTVACGKPA
jgi:hypothetical protein